MIEIPAGTFRMGSDDHYPEEAPTHQVSVDAFSISATTVTNEQFAAFVDATGYVTVAERPLDPADYPGAPPENLVAGSLVFTMTPGPVDLRHLSQWWTWTPGASWRRPEGPRSTIANRSDHPVVHVAYEDAEAYASWAGEELPTEAQWEYAARGGADGHAFVWGDEAVPDGRYLANFWQGDFPWRNSEADGFTGTAPVGSFPPNGFGLFDMAGNVWEWTTDWYSDAASGRRRQAVLRAEQPSWARRRGELRPAPAAVPHPAQGDQGRVVPLCRQLLSALPTCRSTTTDDRHRHEPHRLPHDPQQELTMTADPLRSDFLPSWNDGATKQAIVDFLAAAREVPVADRVAVLDNDGTLWCEKPNYPQLEFLLGELARAIGADPALARARSTGR